MLYISLFSWSVTCPILTNTKVVASVLTMDRLIWICTCLFGVECTAPWTSSAAAVCLWAYVMSNVHRGQVGNVLTSSKSSCSQCWHNFLTSFHLTGVPWRIAHSNGTVAIWYSASDHSISACWAQLRLTGTCRCFVVETFPAQYTKTSIVVQCSWIIYSTNLWDSLANRVLTFACANINIFKYQELPFFS
jgi:hypothetical protein